jgi:hypothetical protein
MLAFQEQASGLRPRSRGTPSAEGTYARVAQTAPTLNRFERTRLEEEEDLRKAIEASLAEPNQGTSLASEPVGRTNETVPLVSSEQPTDQQTMTEANPLETTTTGSTGPETDTNKGFVDGLVSSIFEVRPHLSKHSSRLADCYSHVRWM